MCRRAAVVVPILSLLLLGLLVPGASASSMTSAGSFLTAFLSDAQTYLYAGAGILFMGALIMAGSASYGGFTHLLSVPIYYAVLASIGAGVVSVFLGGVGLAAGATGVGVVTGRSWGVTSLALGSCGLVVLVALLVSARWSTSSPAEGGIDA